MREVDLLVVLCCVLCACVVYVPAMQGGRRPCGRGGRCSTSEATVTSVVNRRCRAIWEGWGAGMRGDRKECAAGWGVGEQTFMKKRDVMAGGRSSGRRRGARSCLNEVSGPLEKSVFVGQQLGGCCSPRLRTCGIRGEQRQKGRRVSNI